MCLWRNLNDGEHQLCLEVTVKPKDPGPFYIPKDSLTTRKVIKNNVE